MDVKHSFFNEAHSLLLFVFSCKHVARHSTEGSDPKQKTHASASCPNGASPHVASGRSRTLHHFLGNQGGFGLKIKRCRLQVWCLGWQPAGFTSLRCIRQDPWEFCRGVKPKAAASPPSVRLAPGNCQDS